MKYFCVNCNKELSEDKWCYKCGQYSRHYTNIDRTELSKKSFYKAKLLFFIFSALVRLTNRPIVEYVIINKFRYLFNKGD